MTDAVAHMISCMVASSRAPDLSCMVVARERPALSVVVPCHNEESTLIELVRQVEEAVSGKVSALEIILIDDGSVDATLARARDLSDSNPSVSYVAFSRNFGKEAAIFAGLSRATGDCVVIMDGDLQHPPAVVGRMLDAFRESPVDQVIARRTRAGDPILRTVIARMYYRTMNRSMDIRLVDGEGDFRLLSRRAVAALLDLAESNRFSKGLFAWIGFPNTVIEYDNVARSGGGSRWTTKNLVNYGLDGVMSFNSRPLRAMIHLGYVIVLLAILYVIWLVVQAATHGIDVPGYITVVAAVVGLAGVQLLCLGVIGEYVGRIYLETKSRPLCLITEAGGSRADRASRGPDSTSAHIGVG